MNNPVVRSEFRGEEEPIDIRTTEIKYKNSFLYGILEKHGASHSSIDIQNTKQSGSFNSIKKLQEGDKAIELEINQFRLKSDDQILLSGCKARTIQLNTDTKKLHKYELMCKNKNQLASSSMIFLSLLLILTGNSSSIMMHAEANDTSTKAYTKEIVRTNTKAIKRTDTENYTRHTSMP